MTAHPELLGQDGLCVVCDGRLDPAQGTADFIVMIRIPFSQARACRSVLPYGQWTTRNGDIVLFNRSYAPFAIKYPDGMFELCDRFWVNDIVKQEFFWDDWTSPWRKRESIGKCCKILSQWGIGIMSRSKPDGVTHFAFRQEDWEYLFDGNPLVAASHGERDID